MAQFLALLIIVAIKPIVAMAEQTDVLRVGAGTITGTVARLNGVYVKWGLDVQRVPSTPSETMRRYLADGTVDIVEDGLDNAVASTLEGVDIVIILGSSLSDQELIAQPEFESVQQLRGKTLIVDAPDTQYALLLKKILLMEGLRAETDYHLKSGITQRLSEMQVHKEYSAGMMGGTTAIFAKRNGSVSLRSSDRALGKILASGAYVRRQWARDHADLLCRYIAAQLEAQRWMLDRSNEARMIQILVDTSEPKVSPEIAAKEYKEMMSGPGALTKDLSFDVPAFKRFLKVRAEVQGSWAGTPPPPQSFYDLSFYQRALSLTRKWR